MSHEPLRLNPAEGRQAPARRRRPPGRRLNAQFVCCALLLFLGAGGYYKASSLIDNTNVMMPDPPLSEIPTKLGGWRGEETQLAKKTIQVAGATSYFSRTCRNKNGVSRYLYIAHYGAPYYDLPHDPDVCLGARGWTVIGKETVILQTEAGVLPVVHALFEKNNERFAALHWYVDSGEAVPTLTSTWSKLWRLIKDVKDGERTWVFQVQIQATAGRDTELTWKASDDLAANLWPELIKHFPAEPLEEGTLR